MSEPRPLEVVFLTNFTDFCYRSIPAIAQMADDFSLRLTIVNTTYNRQPADEDRARLKSFFPEADAYHRCRRIVTKGDPVLAVKRLSMIDPIDLLIAPASDPLGLPRIWHSSLRTRLLHESRIPLWTIDRRTQPSRLRKPPQRVGCWIDFHKGWTNHLSFAAAYASATRAELHVLHALPEIAEGNLILGEEPLHRNTIVEAISRVMNSFAVPTQIHVAGSDTRRTRSKLMEQTALDIIFVAEQNLRLPAWLGSKPRLMNECICPVVYVPVDTAVPVWPLFQDRKAPVEDLVLSFALPR